MVVSPFIVPVHLCHPSSKRVRRTQALLDSCSPGTFITEQLLKRIGVSEECTSISIKTMNGETYKSNVIEGLQISNSREFSKWIKLPKTYSRDQLPVNEEDIITPE